MIGSVGKSIGGQVHQKKSGIGTLPDLIAFGNTGTGSGNGLQHQYPPVQIRSAPLLKGLGNLLFLGFFLVQKQLCVTDLYIAETCVKSRVTGLSLCFKIAILIPLYK